ncbi:hypothetical protein XPA_008518 [Xanthoria parietina]
MVRERPQDSEEDKPRGSRHRRRDDFEDEDQPEYDYEKRPKRGKSEKKSGARVASDDEPDEEGAEDPRYQQQLVVREKPKKAKSSRKQIAPKKRDGSSESSTEASEEEPKREKEKEKRKSKFAEDETIMVPKWEVVHPGEVDEDFVDRLVGVLGHHPHKIEGWIEENLLRRHTQTGEYNIDLMFEQGVLARADKKKWESYLKKAPKNPQLSQALYDLFKARRAVFDAMRASMGSTGRRGDSAGFVPHLNVNYDPRCPNCRACGESCLLA